VRSLAKNEYSVIRLGGRPILALTAGSKRWRWFGIGRYQPSTLKRRLFQWAIRLAIVTGLDVCLFPPRPISWNMPTSDSVADLLDHLLGLVGCPQTKAVMVWPPEVSRERLYIHLLRQDMFPLAFAKLSFDEFNDERLSVETRALRALQELKPRQCRVPAVLDAGLFRSRQYLVVEAVPTDARPVKISYASFPTASVQEYSGKMEVVSSDTLCRFAWWRRYEGAIALNTQFARDVETARRSPTRVCRVHGDLGPANILRSSTGLWIVDWEESCEQAPLLTDFVSYYLGINSRRIIKNPIRGLRDFATRFLCGTKEDRHAAVMALAFLHGTGFGAANHLIGAWNTSRGRRYIHGIL